MPKKKRLTPLTDPENIMVVWQDEPKKAAPPKKAAKRTARKQ
jgi:hypothetical protein